MVNKKRRAAEVAVFVHLRQTFYYSFPPEMEDTLKPGLRIVVPFRHKDIIGVFLGFAETDIDLKPIKYQLDDKPLFGEKLVELALWTSKYYLCGAGELFKMITPKDELKTKVTYKRGETKPGRLQSANKMIYELLTKEVTAATLANKTGLTLTELQKKCRPLIKKGVLNRNEEFYFSSSRTEPIDWDDKSLNKERNPLSPTSEQAKAIEAISIDINAKRGKTTLLHGVTGSGKTEVYLALCEKALGGGGTAIVLVPEIALTFQLVKRFYQRFGNKIALMHSGLTTGQRRDEWKRAQTGEASIVIGARSAVFAPLENLRLIIVDEEHDSSYKQSEYPHYHGRDVAVMRGHLSSAPVVLGSATPSLETFYNASNGKYNLIELPKRVDGATMPKVTITGYEATEKSILPPLVIEEMMKRLNKDEQSLVFINRRGSSLFLRCSVCKEVLECPNCSISLTYHSAGTETLSCHYCGYKESKPFKCRACGVSETFAHKGIGTQKVEQFLKDVFPKAKVGRLDQDTAPNREKAFSILGKFEKGKIDILVGTQMTAKGHDFENLTFSCIVGADDYLAFPDFRSAERTFSLVTQAAGRTGRGKKSGEVVINTESNHYAIQHALSHDYLSFYNEEIVKRKETGYPPFLRLIGIMFDGTSEGFVEREMNRLAANLPNVSSGTQILGPVPAMIKKLRNRYRWKLLLKGGNSTELHKVAVDIANSVDPKLSAYIDVDPIGFF